MRRNPRNKFKLELPKLQSKEGIEYLLNIFAYTKEVTEVLPQNFEIAREQFSISESKYFVKAATKGTNPVVKETKDGITLSASGVEVTINKKTGLIQDYKSNGEVYFKQYTSS